MLSTTDIALYYYWRLWYSHSHQLIKRALQESLGKLVDEFTQLKVIYIHLYNEQKFNSTGVALIILTE